MPGGLRLLIAFFLFTGVAVLMTTNARAQDGSSPSGPPKAKVAPVEDTVQGHKIVDPYRYLENSSNPDTKLFVEQEMAYTRSLLDPLPGRDKINARLAQLLAIGSVDAPRMRGKFYFYTRRDAGQNQPVLYFRDSLHGPNRVLLDINKLSADGTVALDWWYPSEDGKYIAYGTSPSGSEESTLHVIETATGRTLPDAIERTRFSSLAYERKTVPPSTTRAIRKKATCLLEKRSTTSKFSTINSEPIPPVIRSSSKTSATRRTSRPSLSREDDRWLLITVEEGWTKTEMYLQDLHSHNPPADDHHPERTSSTEAKFSGQALHHHHERRRSALPRLRSRRRQLRPRILERTHSRSPTPCCRAQPSRRQLFRALRAKRQLATQAFRSRWQKAHRHRASRYRQRFRTGRALGSRRNFLWLSVLHFRPSIYRYDLKTRRDFALDQSRRALHRSLRLRSSRKNGSSSKDGTRVPMFVVHKKGLQKNGKQSHAAHRLWRLQRQPYARLSAAPPISGWSTAASTPSPTCAAGPSSAKTGTAPACSTRNRMSSTT